MICARGYAPTLSQQKTSSKQGHAKILFKGGSFPLLLGPGLPKLDMRRYAQRCNFKDQKGLLQTFRQPQKRHFLHAFTDMRRYMHRVCIYIYIYDTFRKLWVGNMRRYMRHIYNMLFLCLFVFILGRVHAPSGGGGAFRGASCRRNLRASGASGSVNHVGYAFLDRGDGARTIRNKGQIGYIWASKAWTRHR